MCPIPTNQDSITDSEISDQNFRITPTFPDSLPKAKYGDRTATILPTN